jgi:hypothetical protein
MMVPRSTDTRAEPRGFLSRVVSTVKSVAVVEWNLYLLCEGVHTGSLAEAPHFVPKKDPLTMTVPKVRGARAATRVHHKIWVLYFCWYSCNTARAWSRTLHTAYKSSAGGGVAR